MDNLILIGGGCVAIIAAFAFTALVLGAFGALIGLLLMAGAGFPFLKGWALGTLIALIVTAIARG